MVGIFPESVSSRLAENTYRTSQTTVVPTLAAKIVSMWAPSQLELGDVMPSTILYACISIDIALTMYQESPPIRDCYHQRRVFPAHQDETRARSRSGTRGLANKTRSSVQFFLTCSGEPPL